MLFIAISEAAARASSMTGSAVLPRASRASWSMACLSRSLRAA
jgi:hypothetical protein